MPSATTKNPQSEPDKEAEVKKLDLMIAGKLKEFEKERKRRCYLLDSEIYQGDVNRVYEELRAGFQWEGGELDIIVESSGGDIDASFNLSNLFRKAGSKGLSFFIPRWAKSAATLLVCSGNDIYMTDIAELGPLDPQISVFTPIEKRYEEFSPKDIDGALDIIWNEFEKDHDKLAKELIGRLQWPLTLGGIKKSLELGEQYLIKLLETGMLKGKAPDELKEIAKRLSTGYASHGFCINCDEARELGLIVKNMNGKVLDICWEIYKLINEKKKMETKMKRKEMEDILKEIPIDDYQKVENALSNDNGTGAIK